jgi:NADH-ubiquinone oxidoreductase chain 1
MIPFLTLFERKILRYIQLRKGPKKVSIFGIFQPIRDGIKLFLKERGKKLCSNSLIFWFRPLLNFIFMLILFLKFISFFPSFSINLGVVFYLCFSSLLVYTILISG